MPTNTPPSQETVKRGPLGKPVVPDVESPAKAGRSSEPDARQSEDQKRIERFRER